jgi:hypothetical protein
MEMRRWEICRKDGSVISKPTRVLILLYLEEDGLHRCEFLFNYRRQFSHFVLYLQSLPLRILIQLTSLSLPAALHRPDSGPFSHQYEKTLNAQQSERSLVTNMVPR